MKIRCGLVCFAEARAGVRNPLIADTAAVLPAPLPRDSRRWAVCHGTEAQMPKHRSRKRARRLDAVVQVSGVTGPKSDEATGPKSDDLHPAVRRLLSELDQLLSELQRASSAVPASPKHERERYICILVALGQFVRKVGGTLEQVSHI